MIFDPDLQRSVEVPQYSSIVQQPLPGMTEGYAEYFVGRRRVQQRLLPALKDGSLQVLVLTGIGGSGKSSLATRLARKLQADGFNLIPVSSFRNNPLNAARLFDACRTAFLQAAASQRSQGDEIKARRLEGLCQILDSPLVSVKARLQNMVATLNSDRFLLILDNFESILDENKRTILDHELAEFYSYLLANLSGNSRAIITSRYLPANQLLHPKVKEEALGDFSWVEFIKIMKRDEIVDQRYRSGDLHQEILHQLYSILGGTPRFLLQIRNAIRNMKTEEIRAELASLNLPKDAGPGVLQNVLDKYFESIFVSRLYSYLNPDSQKALSKAAVFGIAMNLDGLAAVTGESKEKLAGFVKEWRDRAFVYPDRERSDLELWSVYGLLKEWLLGQIGSEERKHAHQAAGDFLQREDMKDKGLSLGLNWGGLLYENRIQWRYLEIQ
jgi:hypothetical protein